METNTIQEFLPIIGIFTALQATALISLKKILKRPPLMTPPDTSNNILDVEMWKHCANYLTLVHSFVALSIALWHILFYPELFDSSKSVRVNYYISFSLSYFIMETISGHIFGSLDFPMTTHHMSVIIGAIYYLLTNRGNIDLAWLAIIGEGQNPIYNIRTQISKHTNTVRISNIFLILFALNFLFIRGVIGPYFVVDWIIRSDNLILKFAYCTGWYISLQRMFPIFSYVIKVLNEEFQDRFTSACLSILRKVRPNYFFQSVLHSIFVFVSYRHFLLSFQRLN